MTVAGRTGAPLAVLTPLRDSVGRRASRQGPGAGAGPHRPCLRSESQAVAHRRIPRQASPSQAEAKAQPPLPGTAPGALGDAAAAQAAPQHPGSKGAGQGPAKGKLCRLLKRRDREGLAERWKTEARPARPGPAAILASSVPSAQRGAGQAGSKSARGLGPGKQERCRHSPAPRRTSPGAALREQPRVQGGEGCRELAGLSTRGPGLPQRTALTRIWFYLVRAPRRQALRPASQPAAASHLRGNSQRSEPSPAIPAPLRDSFGPRYLPLPAPGGLLSWCWGVPPPR